MGNGEIVIHKNKTFDVISNYHIRDKNLSLKAIGLLTKLLTMPPEWSYSIRGLTACCKESKNTIRGILKELEEAGYLYREKIQEKNNNSYIWHIYEIPVYNMGVGQFLTQGGSKVGGSISDPNIILNNINNIYKDSYIYNTKAQHKNKCSGKTTLRADQDYIDNNPAPEIIELLMAK